MQLITCILAQYCRFINSSISYRYHANVIRSRKRKILGVFIPVIMHTSSSDMEFVQKFTPLDFQVKNFALSILPNSTVLVRKKHKKGVKMEKFTPRAKIYTAAALTGWTNSTSAAHLNMLLNNGYI